MYAILDGLLIFLLRIIDMTFNTLRFMMMVRGRRLLTWLFAFGGSFVYVVAIRNVLADMSSLTRIVGYAAGFSTGMLVGMFIEERMAVGHTHLEIISPRFGVKLSEKLREEGYAVTEIAGRGKDGAVTLLVCSVARRKASQVEQLILEIDPQAFVAAQDVRPVQAGFWPK
jgi:uncharacterized protein YebE (UPF0316 family)